jgi:hypothetical protein
MQPWILLTVFAYFAKQKAAGAADSGSLPSQALSNAFSQIGVTEDPPGSDSDPRGMIQKYMQSSCWTQGPAAWCAGFVCWCWANTLNPIYFKTAWVTGLENWATQHDVFHRVTAPEDFEKVIPGNFYTIDQNGNGISDHAGIIASFDPETKTLYCIDGNYSSSVSHVARKYTLSNIVGFSTIQTFIQTTPCS